MRNRSPLQFNMFKWLGGWRISVAIFCRCGQRLRSLWWSIYSSLRICVSCAKCATRLKLYIVNKENTFKLLVKGSGAVGHNAQTGRAGGRSENNSLDTIICITHNSDCCTVLCCSINKCFRQTAPLPKDALRSYRTTRVQQRNCVRRPCYSSLSDCYVFCNVL